MGTSLKNRTMLCEQAEKAQRLSLGYPSALLTLRRMPECEPFPELTEAKRSRQPVRLKVMTHNRLFVARVHRPHSFSKFGFCFRHACMLSQVLCPRAHQHFCPEGSRMFEVLVDAEKKSAVAQKDQPKLFDRRKVFFPVFRTNYGFHRDHDGPVVRLRRQRKIVRGL